MVKIHLTCSLPFFVLQFPVILLLFWLCLFFFFFFSKRDCERPKFLSLSIYIFCFYLLFPAILALQGPLSFSPIFVFVFVCFFSLSLLCNRLIGATLLSLSSFWNGFLFLLKFYLSVSIKIHLIKNKKIIHW